MGTSVVPWMMRGAISVCTIRPLTTRRGGFCDAGARACDGVSAAADAIQVAAARIRTQLAALMTTTFPLLTTSQTARAFNAASRYNARTRQLAGAFPASEGRPLFQGRKGEGDREDRSTSVCPAPGVCRGSASGAKAGRRARQPGCRAASVQMKWRFAGAALGLAFTRSSWRQDRAPGGRPRGGRDERLELLPAFLAEDDHVDAEALLVKAEEDGGIQRGQLVRAGASRPRLSAAGGKGMRKVVPDSAGTPPAPRASAPTPRASRARVSP